MGNIGEKETQIEIEMDPGLEEPGMPEPAAEPVTAPEPENVPA